MAPAMQKTIDTIAIADLLFRSDAPPGDVLDCLAEISCLLAAWRPRLLFLCDAAGKFLAWKQWLADFAAGSATKLAGELCGVLSADAPAVCRPLAAPERGFLLAVQLGPGAGGLVGGILERCPAESELPAVAAALAVSGRLARIAIRNEEDARLLRVRLRHLQAEDDMLKDAHTEALANAIEEQSLRLAEAQVRENVEKACQAIEAANRAKSQFLANMSHEIRTPLNAILGFTDLLVRGGAQVEEEERREYLDMIASSGQHLLELINDLLDLSKIEAGHLRLERVTCSPQAVVAQVASELRVRAVEKGITLECEWPAETPAQITTDPLRLRQLLVNLVGNAIKFTEAGTVRIVTRLDRSGDRPRLAFDVVDTGIGIPNDKLESIFDAFVQADNSVTRKFGGTGLGLAISRRIADALGGTLTVASCVGRGSTFTAAIDPGPLDGVEILPAGKHESIRPRSARAAAVALPPVKILVVEDGPINQKLMKHVLQKHGATVATADNGQIGAELALREPFDLILMDMQMPVMDGYAATGFLRQQGLTVPIVALTAHAMSGDEKKCLAAGCSGYVSKPIDIDRLLATILELLAPAADRPHEAPPPAAAAHHAAQPAAAAPLFPTLPMEDPEFRAIAEEFVTWLGEHLRAMRDAWQGRQWPTLAKLAHTLKGTGGSAGFDCFTRPARELEQLSRQQCPEGVAELLDNLDQMAGRIMIPAATY
jgi:signal transduction histidine kinase/ActR/RegA family two-component response regulator/HPt (histidine-containing phosphotransfer) domain-containing protein